MSSAEIDIIIPIWNRPTETRECLAALIQHSRDVRLILLDCGSDQETEQILHNFAEYLDSRALLLRCETSQSFVATVNRGLALTSAPLAIIMRSTCRVNPGWLEPFLEEACRPDAGVLVPRLASRNSTTFLPSCPPGTPAREALHGSFYAVGVTSALYHAIGGFDENLDDNVWCMKDFSRRAERAGFRTLRLKGPPILYHEQIQYGSVARRNKREMESCAAFAARWGEGRVYGAFLAQGVSQEMLQTIFDALLIAARQGHRIFVYTPPDVHRKILAASFHQLHDSIEVTRLPRLFRSRACRSALKQLSAAHGPLRVLSEMEGLVDIEGAERVSFAEFDTSISVAEV